MPEIGTKRADQAKRAGVAERLAEPAAPPRRTVALALLDDADERRQALALALVRTAKPPAPHPLSLLQTVPGMGTNLRLVRLEEMPELARGPRGPDCVSWRRVGKCARHRPGHARGPPARSAAMRSSHGPLRTRRSWFAATIRRAPSIWPAERPPLARARRGLSWPTRSPGRAMLWEHAGQLSLGSRCSRAQGAEPASLRPT
jgi:hypothetical protein